MPGASPQIADPARCQSLRLQLDAADARRVPALAAKANNGAALSADQRREVDAYNDAVQAYTAGQCHTAGKG